MLTYNHAHVIEDVLLSILNQTAPPAEVLVSDDHSTDGTWDLLQRLAARHPTLRPLRPAHNLGMAANANFAVAQAAHPLVALLHHDDICRSDLLAEWTGVAQQCPEAGFVFNGYSILGSDRLYLHHYATCTDGRAFLRELLSVWGCPVRGTALIRRAQWDAVGGMDERFGMLADIDLWMRLAAVGPVGYVRAPLIQVGVVRPEGYPEDYVAFSWSRFRLLYEIHAANVRRAWPGPPLVRAARWAWFRARVSADVMRWVAYATIRRPALLVRSGEVATEYEWPVVSIARSLARAVRAPRHPVHE